MDISGCSMRAASRRTEGRRTKVRRACRNDEDVRRTIFYQKPNWAAVSFSVSAERFRAASSLSDTGVLMAVLTP